MEDYLIITNDIDDETFEEVSDFIIKSADEFEKINLILNSAGGESYAMWGIIDMMEGSPIPVNTYAVGTIQSAALIIFMTGKHRIISPNTSIMSHQVFANVSGKEHEVISQYENMHKECDKMIKHYEKHTGLSKKIIQSKLLTNTDVFLSPDECLKYNIANEIGYFR